MAILFLIVFVDLVGFGIIIPLLPFYAEHFKATPDVVTLVMASYSAAQFVAAPLWGMVSDRIGRKPVLLLGICGAAVSYVWLGFAGSLAALFGARLLGGAMAGNISAAFAYAADVTTPEDRAKGMGMIGAAFGLGFVAGPAIGGLLAGHDPATADVISPSLTAAALSVVALVLGLVLLRESLSADIRATRAAKTRAQRRIDVAAGLRVSGVRTTILLTLSATMVFAGMETTLAMWTERTLTWGPAQNGLMFAGVGIIGVIVQGGLIGPLNRRFGEAGLVIKGSLVAAVGLAALPFATALLPLIGVMVLLAYGFSLLVPSLNALVSLRATAELQGSILGLSRSASILGRVIGPALAGTIFATLGKDAPYFIGAVAMVAIAVLATSVRKRPEK